MVEIYESKTIVSGIKTPKSCACACQQLGGRGGGALV